jgi:glycine oxidase ThiO
MIAAPSQRPRIAIIGAGIIGLGCALELAQRGSEIVVFDKNAPGRGASWAAAGMLAPAFEAAAYGPGADHLFELCLASSKLWPDWAKRLEQMTGMASGYNPEPTIAIKSEPSDVSYEALARALIDKNIAHQQLGQHDLSTIEPRLAAHVQSGIRLPTDTQVDNRLTLLSLISACAHLPNVDIKHGEAELEFGASGFRHEGFDVTLVCAGWQTSIVKTMIDGGILKLVNVDPVLDEIDPYGGQMLSVERTAASPNTTIRAGDLYIVPKRDRVIIGATVEPGVVRDHSETSDIDALLQRASAFCPSLADARVLETWAGVRPGTDTHAPLMGETQADGLFVASGHYRNGILLAPITAKIMADLIIDGEASTLARHFWPSAYISQKV